MKEFNTLDDFCFEDKTVLLRVDFNMPLDKKTLDILDITRIKRALPTIKELREKNAKTVIITHQGRKGSWDFTSLEKHAGVLGDLLGSPVRFIDDIYGEKAKEAIKNLRKKEVLLLDNVRKFDGETEKKTPFEHSQSELVQNLYPLADFFINDAFAAAHRAQCSLTGFTVVLPSAIGRLMEKELKTLKQLVTDPKKPSVFLFGGAKFSDAIKTIKRLLENNSADKILLAGLPANAFLKSEGYNLGVKNEETLLKEGEKEHFEEIKEVLLEYNDRIYMPVDLAYSERDNRKELTIEELPVEHQVFDIGTKTIDKYKEMLKDAKTVFLSGPCGVFENPLFMKGTKEIFTFVANSDAFSIIGGGHTVAAAEQLGITSQISHISTGGGSLEKYMMGEKLPALEALKNKIVSANK